MIIRTVFDVGDIAWTIDYNSAVQVKIIEIKIRVDNLNREVEYLVIKYDPYPISLDNDDDDNGNLPFYGGDIEKYKKESDLFNTKKDLIDSL